MRRRVRRMSHLLLFRRKSRRCRTRRRVHLHHRRQKTRSDRWEGKLPRSTGPHVPRRAQTGLGAVTTVWQELLVVQTRDVGTDTVPSFHRQRFENSHGQYRNWHRREISPPFLPPVSLPRSRPGVDVRGDVSRPLRDRRLRVAHFHYESSQRRIVGRVHDTQSLPRHAPLVRLQSNPQRGVPGRQPRERVTHRGHEPDANGRGRPFRNRVGGAGGADAVAGRFFRVVSESDGGERRDRDESRRAAVRE
mmetsp:Transcript_9294/g.11465  ORF Transcript_9294/g.11465 Transcript_9294/m.11465 type:complete len:248 (+) Transcript_9294:756-1499(+)